MLPHNNLIPVDDAASRLDVHPSRVRAMASAGQLGARKIAGRWFLDEASIEHRRESDVANGRPFSSKNAWALICIAQGEPVDWISSSEKSRLRRHLSDRGLGDLAPRLRGRARVLRYRAHPAALDRLASESRVVRAGVSAAAEYGIDIQASEELEAYVLVSDVDHLVNRFHLEPSDRPNVVLHVLEDDDPFHWQGCVGPAVAALDLLQSRDARSRRAAKEFLERFDNNVLRPSGEDVRRSERVP